MNNEQGNLLEQINDDIFRIKNQEKQCDRKKKQCTCILGIIFFISELVINGQCLFSDSLLKPLVYIDLVCYVGLTIIGIIEIYLLKKKMSKQKKEYIRKRAKFGVWLRIYFCWTIIMFLLLIIHTFFQLYFGIFKFDQDCFYFQSEINGNWFTITKITLLTIFFVIEISIFLFIYVVLEKTVDSIKNPYKNIDTIKISANVFQSSIFK